MTEHKRLVDNIQSRLAFYVSNLKISTDRDYFDEHKEAEYFFCKPLSLLFDANVTNINSERRNFPGIDLADRNKRISFQITSTNTKQKVQHTLDEFLDNNLDKDFDRVIVLIVGDKTPPPCANLTLKRPFDFDVKRDVWNVSRLIQEFEALSADDQHKLRGFSEYLESELPNYIAPPKTLHLPLVSALQSSAFVGRKDELATIRKKFDDGDKLVVLTGLGGMGKTELAVKFGRDYEGAVYFTRFDTSFTKTLANMAVGIRPALSDEELHQPEGTLCAIVLELLSKTDENDLLIIDNADSDTGSLADLQKDAGYQSLMRLPLKVLLTTRSESPRTVKIRAMDEKPLFEIFKNHGADVDDNEKRSLIAAVEGHTLTIDLIARTLADNWVPVSTDDMLNAIENSTLSVEDFPEVGADYNQNLEQMHIYQRLRSVFQVAKIPDVEKSILRCATLLPKSGMDVKLFRTALTDKMRKAFPNLGKRGWLTAETGLLTIHPVIRLVCRTELTPTDENCGDFLNALEDQFNPAEYDEHIYTQLAETFALAATYLEDKNAQWSNFGGNLFLDLAQYENAKRILEKNLSRINSGLIDLEMSAAIYNALGVTYSQLGKYDLSLKYRKQALEIGKSCLATDSATLASYYLNVGYAYHELGDYDDALKYQLKAIDMFVKTLDEMDLTLAAAYNHISITYTLLKKYSDALLFQQKSLKIRQAKLLENDPSLAISYDSLADIYSATDNHEKALESRFAALGIFEKKLRPNHPDLAISYDNVGRTYAELKEYSKALLFQMKALEIDKSILSDDNPRLSVSYYNVGNDYFFMGKFEEALPYLEKAYAILQKSFPNGQEHIVTVTELLQQCNDAIRMKENMSINGFDFSRPLTLSITLPFIK